MIFSTEQLNWLTRIVFVYIGFKVRTLQRFEFWRSYSTCLFLFKVKVLHGESLQKSSSNCQRSFYAWFTRLNKMNFHCGFHYKLIFLIPIWWCNILENKEFTLVGYAWACLGKNVKSNTISMSFSYKALFFYSAAWALGVLPTPENILCFLSFSWKKTKGTEI